MSQPSTQPLGKFQSFCDVEPSIGPLSPPVEIPGEEVASPEAQKEEGQVGVGFVLADDGVRLLHSRDRLLDLAQRLLGDRKPDGGARGSMSVAGGFVQLYRLLEERPCVFGVGGGVRHLACPDQGCRLLGWLGGELGGLLEVASPLCGSAE